MASTGETWRLGRRPALDGLRGVAALLVVAAHAGFLPGPAGAIAVTCFFVLSGFLITRVIVEAQQERTWSFREFMLARLVRLFPALAAMVAVVSLWMLAEGAGVATVARIDAHALLYVQNLFMDDRLSWGVFMHTWSLAVEEQFYLGWPLLLTFLLRKRVPVARVAVAVMVASLVARLALSGVAYEAAASSLIGNAFALLAGCALAAGRPLAPRRGALPWGVGGLAAVLIATAPEVSASYLLGPILCVPFAVLLVVHAATAKASPLAVAPLRYVGRISYSLYLWHFPMLAVCASVGVRALPAVLLSGVVAALSTRFLEEPLRRRWRARRIAVPEVVSALAYVGRTVR